MDALWKAWLTRERMDEINRGALAWQRETTRPCRRCSRPSRTSRSVYAGDRERVIREMVGTLGEVAARTRYSSSATS